MGRPKKQTSARKSGLRRSHLVLELARKVNAKLSNIGSTVKVRTTKREGAGKVTGTAETIATKTKKAA